jgi:hypothetical protein
LRPTPCTATSTARNSALIALKVKHEHEMSGLREVLHSPDGSAVHIRRWLPAPDWVCTLVPAVTLAIQATLVLAAILIAIDTIRECRKGE